MARILVNKHFSNSNEIKETIFDALHGKGEIIISNEVGSEGLYIMNDSGVVVKVSGIDSSNTTGTTTPDEYKEYLKNYLETYYWTSAQTVDYVQKELSNFSGSNIDENVVKNIVITETSALSETIRILIDSDSGKSVRSIAIDEISKVVSGAPESFDTLKEIADWIGTASGVSAATLVADIENLKEAVSSASAYTDTRIEEVKDFIQNTGVYAHQPLTYDQYTELITNGTIEITDENGVTNTIVYDDNTFYAIYE